MQMSSFVEIIRNKYNSCKNQDLKYDKKKQNYGLEDILSKYNTELSRRLTTNGQQLLYNYTFKQNIIPCISFSINKTTKHGQTVKSNYAYLYFNGELPAYICYGPSFGSADGEYRKNFVRYTAMDSLKNLYPELWGKIDDLIVHKLEIGELQFEYSMHGADFYKNQLCDSRIQINLFIMAWLSSFHNIYLRIGENHMNPAYQVIIADIKDKAARSLYEAHRDDPEFIHLICYTLCHVDEFKCVKKHIRVDSPLLLRSLISGQKIYPMTVFDLSNPYNIKSKLWLDIYLQQKITNLVINYITPGFPIFNSWFLVHPVNEQFYDNVQQYERYDYSAKTIKIANYMLDRGADDENVHDAVISAERNLILTDYALVAHSEYIGRTLRDIPNIALRSGENNLNDSKKYYRLFKEPKLFISLLFQYIYAFSVMNVYLGAIHGDPHLNNVTIQQILLGSLFDKPQPVLFALDPEHIYCLDFIGFYAGIIDFSRALLSGEKMLPDDYNSLFIELFLSEQRARVIAYIAKFTPAEYQKYRPEITKQLQENYVNFFRVITVIDTIILTDNLLKMFAEERTLDAHPDIVVFIKKLNDNAWKNYRNNLRDIIGAAADIAPAAWPNLVLLRENFGDYLFDRARISAEFNNIVIDMFFLESEMPFDMAEYESWPAFLKIETVLAAHTEAGRTPDPEYYPTLEFLKKNRHDNIANLAKTLRIDHDEDIDESWIYEG